MRNQINLQLLFQIFCSISYSSLTKLMQASNSRQKLFQKFWVYLTHLFKLIGRLHNKPVPTRTLALDPSKKGKTLRGVWKYSPQRAKRVLCIMCEANFCNFFCYSSSVTFFDKFQLKCPDVSKDLSQVCFFYNSYNVNLSILDNIYSLFTFQMVYMVILLKCGETS